MTKNIMPLDGPPVVVCSICLQADGYHLHNCPKNNIEKDPNGKSAHDPGSKLDDGKVDLDLVLGGFCRALLGVGAIGTFGARKYTPDGWMSVPDGTKRYTSALLRHLFAIKKGEMIDPDSGLPHVDHLAWNALAVAELTHKEKASANV